MTVLTTFNRSTQFGDGVTTVFSFPFAIRVGGQTDIQVFITTADGVVTQLTYGTQYNVTINPPISPNPTPVGGLVTLASAVPNGASITIIRTMPLTQTTSLANQGTLWQPVLEALDDDQAMQLQQLGEILGRQISVAIGDPAPLPLPPANQRANLTFMFDSAGNPIAAQPGGASTPVSSAMAPVVAAATIAQALALLGLTGVSPEPTGVVKAWCAPSTATPPAGYLLCGGQPVSRGGANTALFALIGTTFGAGDGSTTFNVPDLRGRVPAGLDNINGIDIGRMSSVTIPNNGGPTSLGGWGGGETINLIQSHLPNVTPTFAGNDLPAHTHTSAGGGTLMSLNYPGAGTGVGNLTPFFATPANPITSDSAGKPTGSISSINPGAQAAVPLVQPTIMLNYIIKL